MFIGEYQHSLDAKSRIIVPSKFREELGSKFILTKDFFDKCLVIYSVEAWNEYNAKALQLPSSDKDARALIRSMASGAVECEIDKQGRLVIPQHLRDYANIEKELVTVGVLKKIEIWGKEEWEAYNEKTRGEEQIATKMAEMGL